MEARDNASAAALADPGFRRWRETFSASFRYRIARHAGFSDNSEVIEVAVSAEAADIPRGYLF